MWWISFLAPCFFSQAIQTIDNKEVTEEYKYVTERRTQRYTNSLCGIPQLGSVLTTYQWCQAYLKIKGLRREIHVRLHHYIQSADLCRVKQLCSLARWVSGNKCLCSSINQCLFVVVFFFSRQIGRQVGKCTNQPSNIWIKQRKFNHCDERKNSRKQAGWSEVTEFFTPV